MDPANFEEIQSSLQNEGPRAAIDQLCAALRERKDYARLFHALLMKKRHQLGISPVPFGSEVPPAAQEEYENGIREACRTVGRLFLDDGNIPEAWRYFGMVGEPEPVAQALDRYQPGEDEDCQPLVEIALHYGVHPKKGFDLVLQRFGICNAITTASNMEFPQGTDVREYCIQRLVRALYQELVERLRAEVEAKEGKAPTVTRVRALMAGHDWLFEEGFSHIDVSHLGAVVQMSIYLSPGEELEMARELCEYGQRLAPQFHYAAGPPFDDQYRDYGIYLATLAGDRTEEGIAHFVVKAERADPEEVGTYPAEVVVNLLLRLNRPMEALAVARRFLSNKEGPTSCPSISELCQRVGDYQTLAAFAREQGDPVHYMAGLIAAKK